MKKFSALLFAICSVALFSCSDPNSLGDQPTPPPPPGYDGWIWDFVPTNIVISIFDEKGTDLLDPKAEKSIRNYPIYITYKERKHEAKDMTSTKMIDTQFYGLHIRHSEKLNRYVLSFGQFGVTDNYRKEPFTLFYGDGKSTLVEFDAYITWEYSNESKRNEPTIWQAMYVDDQQKSQTNELSLYY